MPDIGGLQLLPETRRKIEVSLPGQNRPLIFSVIALALVIGFYFGLLGYKQSLFSAITSIDNQLADLEKSRDKQLETRLLDLNKQLVVINPLMNSHFFWSSAFIKIQSLVQPQVQFKSVNADTPSKKITINGFAAGYTTVARQIASFYTTDSITDLILNKVQSRPSGQLEFTMQLFFDPDKMLTKK